MELGTCICFKLTVTDWFPIQVESITHTLCKLRSYIDAVQARAYTFLLKCNFFFNCFFIDLFLFAFSQRFPKAPRTSAAKCLSSRKYKICNHYYHFLSASIRIKMKRSSTGFFSERSFGKHLGGKHLTPQLKIALA